jgi:hypothetical protein
MIAHQLIWPIGPADKTYNVKPSLRMKKRYEAIKDATNGHSRNRLRRARKNEALPQLACEASRVFNVVDFIGGPNRPLKRFFGLQISLWREHLTHFASFFSLPVCICLLFDILSREQPVPTPMRWGSNLPEVHLVKFEGRECDRHISGIEGFGRFISAKTRSPNLKKRDSCAGGSPVW